MTNKTIGCVSLVSLALTALSGCIIFDNGNQCEVSPAMPAPTRNPYTGECEAQG